MSVVVDHVFICTTIKAPGADRLRRFGLAEGLPNQHPGQGTACRRFFFRNAMLELLWVEDVAATQSNATRRTKLWERWSERERMASPFGIVLRPAEGTETTCPFLSWEYKPAAMPDLMLHVAEDTHIGEPMWCYMEGGRAPAGISLTQRQPRKHAFALRDITEVHIVCPQIEKSSLTLAMTNAGVISSNAGPEHLLELEFDGGSQANRVDFRPDLPLVFNW